MPAEWRVWAVLVMVVAVSGIGKAIPSALVVSGDMTLTADTLSTEGYQSITIMPSGVLTILTPVGSVPLEVRIQRDLLVQGAVRILEVVGTTLTPTGNGGAVFFNLPAGAFTVESDAGIDAGGTNGGVIQVAAAAMQISGAIIADGGQQPGKCGGAIALAALGNLEVANPSAVSDGTLALLSATGYRGGNIRLASSDDWLYLRDTSFLDAGGEMPLLVSEAAPNETSATIRLTAKRGAVLSGLRRYGSRSIPKTKYVMGKLECEVTAGPLTLERVSSMVAASFPDEVAVSDAQPAKDGVDRFQLSLAARKHRGDVRVRADLGGGMIINGDNSVEITGAQLRSFLSLTSGGYLRMAGVGVKGYVSIYTSRIQLDNVRFENWYQTVSASGKATSFTDDVFEPGEQYTTPCPLSLSRCTIGANVKIACEGSLGMMGGFVGDNAILQAGQVWKGAFTFSKPLATATTLLNLSGVSVGNGVQLGFFRPSYYPAKTVCKAGITGTGFGTGLRLTTAGHLSLSSSSAQAGLEMRIFGDISFSGDQFSTGTVHYAGKKTVSFTSDRQLVYLRDLML